MSGAIDHGELVRISAHSWRGECIDQFAQLELIIADALATIAKAKPSLKVRRLQQIGPSFEELKRLVGTENVLPKPYGIGNSLVEIDRILEWRAHLTHGVMTIKATKSKEWMFRFRHRDPGDETLRTHKLRKQDADQLLADITKEVTRFRSRIGHLRAGFRSMSD